MKILTSEILQSAPNELKEPDMNSTLYYMHLLETRGTNCPAFRSTISRFQETADFRIFPLIPILHFQNANILF